MTDDSLLRSMSLEELASALARTKDAIDTQSLGSLPPVEGDYPVLSYAQERLLFMDRLSPGNPFYNMPQGYDIEGSLDPEALSLAWLDLVRRHETLRSVFPHDERGIPCVRFIAPERCALEIRDLRDCTDEEKVFIVETAKENEVTLSFNLAEGPLTRGTLFHLAERRFVFLFNFHHCIVDGWSMAIFNKELFHAYEARKRGSDVVFSPLAATHGQFAAWQRKRMEGQEGQREYDWWRSYLSDVKDLSLYTDKPRPAIQRFKGDQVRFTVPLSLRKKLEKLAERTGASPFMLWMALYSILLGRYSGQRRFTVGSALAGRAHPATEGIVGFLVNNMVVKVENRPDASFVSHLEETRQSVLQSFTHGELPFQMLAQGLGRHCDLSRNPVYQAGLTYQNTPAWGGVPQDLSLESCSFPAKYTHVDLELLMWEDQDGLLCSHFYDSDIFTRPTVEALSSYLLSLAEAIVAAPERSVYDLMQDNTIFRPLPGRPDSYLESPADMPVFRTPWERLRFLVERKPDAPALILCDDMPDTVPGRIQRTEGTEYVSWARLAMMGEQVSSVFAPLPVGSGKVTAILLYSGVEMLVASLAVWHRNGAWVLLDPDNPASRLRDTLRDLQVDCLVSTLELLRPLELDAHGLGHIPVVETKNWRDIAPEAEVPAFLPVKEDDVACVFCTSGSTGRPKGVRILHEGMARRIQWEWDAYPLTDDDLACMKSSVSYADFLIEVYGAILTGTPLLLLGHSPARDVPRLLQKLEQYSVTKMIAVPTVLRTMHRITDGLKGRLQHLRYLRTSGEALTHRLAADTLRAIPGLTLYSVYGATEMFNPASFLCTSETLQNLPADGVLPAGKLLPGRKVAILDENGLPVPLGEKGIIYAGGWGLSGGYITGEDNEAFCQLNLSGSVQRWYNSGDVGFFDEKGTLHITGRKDYQLKIRGVRMEAAEIESAIRTVGQVPEAKALAWEDAEGNQRLLGFALRGTGVPEEGEATFTANLRRGLFEVLPAVMVPDSIMILDEWPRTSTGKVSEQLLGELFRERSLVSEHKVQERSGTQAEIAQLWNEVLGCPIPDNNSTFFEAGGNSLLLVNLHHKLQKVFGKTFPLLALFQNPTVESQANFFAERPDVSADAFATVVPQTGRRGLAARRGTPVS